MIHELLNVREYYASLFVAAVLSNPELLKVMLATAPKEMQAGEAVAREGIRMADALITELNKDPS